MNSSVWRRDAVKEERKIRMANVKKAIQDLALIAVGILVVDVIFEATGIALATLNTAVANLNSYVSVSTLASVITTITPIVNIEGLSFLNLTPWNFHNWRNSGYSGALQRRHFDKCQRLKARGLGTWG